MRFTTGYGPTTLPLRYSESMKLGEAGIPYLDAENWPVWKKRMQLYLTIEGVWDAVKTGQPEEKSETAKALIGLR